ncbi:MAG: hypothetical protein QNK03_11540 [Myxococcota bacterium]|nr:hypothetical protein [Myxococcota bacterium]
MSARARLALVAAGGAGLLLVVACARPVGTAPVVPARVQVEVYRGLAAPPHGAGSHAPVRVDLVVDVRRSTDRTASDPADARRGAAALIDALPAGTELTLRAVGHREGAGCTAAERLLGPAIPSVRTAWAERVRQLRPRAEGSLAEALDAVRQELRADGAAERTRVMVFSDFAPGCGADLCESARALVESGAWVDFVAADAERAPACIERLQPVAAGPGPTVMRLSPPPPAFRVAAFAHAAPGDASRVLAEGRAGAAPVEVAAGEITVHVQLDPPEQIGPLRVAPGSFTRVRLLDYPSALPPARIWRVEREELPPFAPPPQRVRGLE